MITTRQQQQQQQELDAHAAAMDKAASVHVFAQQLNNVACACLEIGQYDKAMNSLGKALRLSEVHIPDQLFDVSYACSCHECSLDGCITHSEQIITTAPSSSNNTDTKNGSTRSCSNMMNVDTDADDVTRSTKIYRRPIRIPKRSVREGHNMGSTLFLIITFNLAMAHHLKTIAMLSSISKKNNTTTDDDDDDDDDTAATKRLIHHTLHLYRLVNEWQHRYKTYNSNIDFDDHDDHDSNMEEQVQNNNPFSSVRFNMILCNNLSHLHRLLKNDEMSKRCLEHLLSNVLVVIDQNKNTTTTTTTTNDVGSVRNDDIEFEFYDDDDNEEEDHTMQQEQQQSRNNDQSSIDVEGFLENASSLILNDHCADAA